MKKNKAKRKQKKKTIEKKFPTAGDTPVPSKYTTNHISTPLSLLNHNKNKRETERERGRDLFLYTTGDVPFVVAKVLVGMLVTHSSTLFVS